MALKLHVSVLQMPELSLDSILDPAARPTLRPGERGRPGNRRRSAPYGPGRWSGLSFRTHGSLAAVVIAAVSLVAAGCGHTPGGVAAEVAEQARPLPGVLLPPVPPSPGPAYVIQLGDELHVRFHYQPEMDEQLPVRPDGRISLGATGELDAVGLTPVELEQRIVEHSRRRLRDPVVTVIVTKTGEQRVYVGGEVGRPGYVVLRPDMTLLQAVVQSGDFRKTARLDSVLLLSPGANGKVNAARINVEQVVEHGVSERVRLRPNDVVYVPSTWIANMDVVVDQWVRGLIPALPRVGVGYSLSNN